MRESSGPSAAPRQRNTSSAVGRGTLPIRWTSPRAVVRAHVITAPRVERGHPVRDRLRHRGLALGEEDAHALGADLADQAGHGRPVVHRQAAERVVEEQEPGPEGQGLREREPSQRGRRQAVAAPARVGGEPDPLEQRRDARAGARARPLGQHRGDRAQPRPAHRQRHRVRDRERPGRRRKLAGPDQPLLGELARAQAGHLAAVEDEPARLGGQGARRGSAGRRSCPTRRARRGRGSRPPRA